MLLFVVPLKSRKISRNWALTSRLFERCLRAICNQTSPDFRVVVVCNERPPIAFHHPQVHYRDVDFPPPVPDATAESNSGSEYGFDRGITLKNADKARKIQAGLDYGQRYDPSHGMVVDADDCVSCHLAQFVDRNARGAGWVFNQGYIYPEGGRFVYLNRKSFNATCGTSLIFASRLRPALFSNPNYYNHSFSVPFDGIKPLPFVGAVYSMANGDNIYMTAETKSEIRRSLLGRLFSRDVFSVARKAMKYWPALLTRSLRAEFGLYKIEETELGEATAAAAPYAVCGAR